MRAKWMDPHVKLSLTAALAWALIGCGNPTPQTSNPVQPIAMAQLEAMVSAENFSGLVAVFASWCPPCRKELPAIARLYREGLPKGIHIIGVSLDEGETKTVQRLVNELELPFPVYQVGMPAAAHYKLVGIPTLMTIKNGRILEKTAGQQSHAAIAAKLKSLSGPAT